MVHDDSGRTPSFHAIEARMRSRLHRPGTVLDVGCASGPFMLVLRERGWKPVGIDINARAVEAARARGLEVHLGTLEEVPRPTGYFDAAVMMNSLEYFARPLESLARVTELLRPGGVLALETPNTVYHRKQVAIGRLLGIDTERLMMVEPLWGRRLIAFSPSSIRIALAGAGFQDIDVSPAVPRASGALGERALRKLIFASARLLFRGTVGRILFSPSMLVVATRGALPSDSRGA